ncbi:hypothetical protein IT407_00495 [Candidatus Uhrbacteria bacterium]|nr:hypothetical protein [Candidatus Uhrbacteria bacterium]
MDNSKTARLGGKARRDIIQAALADARKLQAEGFSVRLPLLRNLPDEELRGIRALIARKGAEARKAKAEYELGIRKGNRPVRSTSGTERHYDPVVERIREVRREHQAKIREALSALSGLNLCAAEVPEAAE